LPSTTFHDLPINHQYSKSFAFEQTFNHYASSYISPSYRYFSVLRPLNELQIARSIAKRPQFFGTFVSCNVKGRQGAYCLNCPKCAFTTLILAAFVHPSKLNKIFGGNMLENPKTLPIFKSLLALTTHKPLDCIGTETESSCAALMAIDQYHQAQKPLPPC
jgi:UDP-N-acetyl-alpha-D-muramoyl-L-alanyl-L-glutamate epimerase